MSELNVKISESRADLVFEHPFFGAVVLRLNLEANEQISTMDVDGKTIRYNPKFAETLTTKELTGVFVHEGLHVIMLHHTRCNGRDPYWWNVACDYAINDIILRNGFDLPKERLHDDKYHDMLAEDIYEKLKEEYGDKDGNFPQPQGGWGMDSDGDSPAPNNGSGGQTPVPLDEIRQPATESERKMAEQEAKELGNTAITAGKEAGNMPAGMERMLGEAQESKIPWEDQLRDLLDKMIRGDQVWHRPNKRLLDTVYLPHFEEEPAGDIVLAIDTSGSIGQKELNIFASELHAIIRENHIEQLDVLWIDTEVASHQVFKAYEELDLQPAGGGGTAFEPAFEWVEEQQMSPNALIYFTDGYGSFPNEQPNYPVIWGMISDVEPPWGTRLELEF